jgi:hypothetical protein
MLKLIDGKPDVTRFIRIVLEECETDDPKGWHSLNVVTELHMRDAVIIVADGPEQRDHRATAAVFHVRDGEVVSRP